MMATTKQLVTAEELLCLPDDGFRYELVRGELRKMPPAGQHHGAYALSIGASLRNFAMASGLGKAYAAETGFKLETDPDHVRAPSVAYLSRERVKAIGDCPGYVPGPPDMAVDVIIPTDTYTEIEEKIADWLDHGTRAVVIVDPSRHMVKVSRSITDDNWLTVADTLAVEDVVPGWEMPVREIFE